MSENATSGRFSYVFQVTETAVDLAIDPDDVLQPFPAPTGGGFLVGYGRQQNLDRQIRALTKAGCTKIFTDKRSGKNTDRPELTAWPTSARATPWSCRASTASPAPCKT